MNMKAKWSKLNHLQLGRYAEYLVKMAFTGAGLDVYTAEVDDKGIDFVIRKSEHEYFDVQVKSIRKAQYVYMTKETFEPRGNLLLALVIFEADDQEPALLLIPSTDWIGKAHPCLKDYDYKEGKSKPEFGIRVTKSNAEEIKCIPLMAFSEHPHSLFHHSIAISTHVSGFRMQKTAAAEIEAKVWRAGFQEYSGGNLRLIAHPGSDR